MFIHSFTTLDPNSDRGALLEIVDVHEPHQEDGVQRVHPVRADEYPSHSTRQLEPVRSDGAVVQNL